MFLRLKTTLPIIAQRHSHHPTNKRAMKLEFSKTYEIWSDVTGAWISLTAGIPDDACRTYYESIKKHTNCVMVDVTRRVIKDVHRQ